MTILEEFWVALKGKKIKLYWSNCSNKQALTHILFFLKGKKYAFTLIYLCKINNYNYLLLQFCDLLVGVILGYYMYGEQLFYYLDSLFQIIIKNAFET